MQAPSILTGLGTFATVVFTGLQLLKGQAKALVTAQATHTLVNSDHGVSLRLNSTNTQRIADLTKDPNDQSIATAAKRAADDHDNAQALVNIQATGAPFKWEKP